MEKDSKSFLNIEKIGRQPLNVIAYTNIKAAIINGDLPQGTKITETEVAKQMDISATPVREALRRLSAEGFVKIIPWSGVIVQSFSEKEILEAYECREALEVQSIRLAVKNIDKEGIAKLHEILDRTKDVEDVTKLVEANSEIHNLLISYSDNKKLKSLLDSLNDVIYHDRNISANNHKRRKQIYLEHVEIIDAVENKDSERSEKAMRIHIKNGLDYILT